MNLAELRARLAEITKSLGDLNSKADRSNEDISQMAALAEEFETLETQISALEKSEAVLAKAQASAGRKTEPTTVAKTAPRIEVGASGTDRFGGFKSSAEFLMAVRDVALTGKRHETLQNAMYTKTGEDGGFLVPEDIGTEIQKVMFAEESLLAKTRQTKVSGNTLSLPIDHSQPWNSGIRGYWIKEGDEFTQSKPKLGRGEWKLKKVGALVVLTEELREDAVAIESYVKTNAPSALLHTVNESILNGTGVGEMQGILNSAFTVTVAKESGQSADTVVARNILAMYSRMIPAYRKNAFWAITPEVEPQLLTMKDDAGNFIYMPPGGLNQAPYGLLMGLPVKVMMSGLNKLGDAGDIVLMNLDAYYSIYKAGIRSDISTHVYFERDMTAFKFVQRVDGHCPFKAPVNPANSTYPMSAFVKLADRA